MDIGSAISTFLVQARKWCRGRKWLPRLLLLLFFAYLLVQYLANTTYVSIFHGLNLGIHEIGHFIFRPFGEFIEIGGGSFFQCLVPLLSIIMFYGQRDFFGIAFSFGWLSTNLFEVSTYAGDARAMELPLVSPFHGGDEAQTIHDWNYLLLQTHLLSADHFIAGIFEVLAVISMVACLGFGAWLILYMIPMRGDPEE